MNCVILQPSYIPWRGFFHQIQRADLFVFYDDVQYDKRGWRNRNQLKTSSGKKWLSIPVNSSGAQTERIPISQIRISWEKDWGKEHLLFVQHNYARAPYFKHYEPVLRSFFQRRDEFLADLTTELTIALARELGIHHTRFIRSSELNASGEKTDRLIDVLKKVGASHYISGPAARDYIEPDKFEKSGISLEYMDYNYPEYPQLYPPFDPFVSVLDLLFMTGPDASADIWNQPHAANRD
jgi:hypothetical protein